MAGVLERELKVEVDDSFHVPDLSASIGVSIVSLPEVTLEATYYDTSTYQLARFGATLRHRVSSAGSQTWTLKLPAPVPAGGPAASEGGRRRKAERRADTGLGPSGSLDRDELDFEGPADKVPADAVALLRTYLRDSALQPVAVLETRRRRNLLMSATDTLAEMDDDAVEYRVVGGGAGSFRELEIELSASGPPAILRRIHDVLVGAGVTETVPQPKLFRALGQTPAPAVPAGPARWGHCPSSAELVSGLMRRATAALLSDDPRIRLGDDPQALGRWRVELGRLAVRLEDTQRLLDRDWYEEVRTGIETLCRHVDAVADLDAVVGRLTAGSSRLLPEDQRPADELVELIASHRKSHHEPLGDHLDSPAYLDLVDRLVAAAQDAPVRRGRSRPAAVTVERALRGRLDRLERAAADAAADGFHPSLRARSDGQAPDTEPLARAAAEARYTSELGAELAGRPARKLHRSLTEMDGWLDELGAATACQRWLRDTGPELGGRQALAAGQLLAGETERANRARRRWESAWKSVRKHARKWPKTG